jgi:hypothetical protein
VRIAAGTILIILGAVGMRGLIYLPAVFTSGLSSISLSVVFTILLYTLPAAFYITAGVFCLRKKYWRVCLASASFAVLIAVFPVVATFVMLGRFVVPWTAWFVVIGAVISVIFISLSKKEWQEIQDSVDDEVSNGG